MGENSIILKNSLILYVRLIIVSIIGILSSRFILQALGISDYGLYNVVGGIVTMMAFLNTVMSSTTYRYIAYEMGNGQSENIVKVFNISVVIHFLIAILVVIFSATIGVYYIKHVLNVDPGKINDALFVFFFAILGTVISILAIPFQGLLTATERFAVTAPVEIFRSLLNLVVILTVMHFVGNRIRLYSILVAIVTCIPTVCYYRYCKYHFPSIVKWKFQRDKKKYKEMLGFSGWIMFGAAASVGLSQGSALIINSFFGTILNAGYGIANQVNNLVTMFAQSLNQAVIPQITKSYSSGKTDRTLQLVIYSSKYSFFLMLIPSFPILLELDFILNLWLVNVPVLTKVFIQIMIINALINTMSAGVPAAIQATGKIKYFQIILSSLMLLVLPIGYFLFKMGFAAYYILLCYSIISLVTFTIQNVMLKKIIKFNVGLYLKKGCLKMVIVFVSVLPMFIIRDYFEPGAFRFICISIISEIWLFAAIYFFGIETREKEIVSIYTLKLKRKIIK